MQANRKLAESLQRKQQEVVEDVHRVDPGRHVGLGDEPARQVQREDRGIDRRPGRARVDNGWITQTRRTENDYG